MDQDSAFDAPDIAALTDLARQKHDDARIAVLGSSQLAQPEGTPPFKDSRTVITSGSLNRLSALKAVGGFNEALFIDCVDFDLCYRLGEAGYRTVQCNHIRLQHRQGHQEIRHFRGQRDVTFNYSPTRYYYQVRNNLYMARRFPGYRRQARRKIRRILRNVLLFETNKPRKLAAILQGMLHVMIGRDGPRP